MGAASLLERLYLHSATRGLFPIPGIAVLAVSGGPDSVALLDLFAALRERLSLDLAVAHADHGIAADSGAIAARVAQLAQRYGMACETGRLTLGPGTSETRAREARYAFLRRVQDERGARYLVTAHHADDQAETVLLRILRGSAPAGLAGIPSQGPRGLVRPLLPFTHAELLAHARSLGVELADDPANSDPRHLRSWVRTALLPEIKGRLGDAATDALRSVASHAGREVRAWEHLLEELPGLDVRTGEGRCDVARDVLTGYHKVLGERVLRAAARRAGLLVGPTAAARAVAFAARSESGRRLELGKGLVAEIAFERLVILRERNAPAPARIHGDEGQACFGAWTIRWRREAAPGTEQRAAWTSWFAADTLEVRGPAAGERLVPLGGTGRRRVARLLMEARVARADRESYPVVADASGPLWLPGVCRSETARPVAGTSALRVDVGRS